MEMCYEGALVLPKNCIALNSDEMEYIDGGLSISRTVFKWGVTAAVTAALVCLGGVIAVAGLKTVLASMALKNALLAAIVKGAGILGIKIGNALASTMMAGFAGAVGGDFIGTLFDKYIDGLDGKKDGYIKIW